MTNEKMANLLFSDFKGGLVTNRPTDALANNESPDLDNINLLSNGFLKRNGDSAFCEAMNSGANVQGLAYYKPLSAIEYLVTVCGNAIYKSDALDGDMDDITGGLTITSGQNYIWQFSKQNDLLIGVGGAPDAPFAWPGTGDAALLGGSPPTGSFTFATRNRVFIGGTVAAPSTIYWSVLSNPEDWSGTGSGNITVDTNDGDYFVGGIPFNNNITLLFKNYSIHQLVTESAPFPTKPLVIGEGACGKNAMVYAEGLAYFINTVPRMCATDGYTIQYFPEQIDDLWDGLNKDRLSSIFGVYYAPLRQIHWYCSYDTSTTNDYCIIWDLGNKCWLRYTTGYDCNVAAVAAGYRLFGGHYNGIIYEKLKSGVFSDESEAITNINSYWRTPWIKTNSFSTLNPRYMDIIAKTQTTGKVYYTYGFNFTQDTTNGNFTNQSVGGIWGTDLWGSTFIWGGEAYKQRRIYTFGYGNNLQIKVYNNEVDEQLEINAFEVALRGSGIKEIGV